MDGAARLPREQEGLPVHGHGILRAGGGRRWRCDAAAERRGRRADGRGRGRVNWRPWARRSWSYFVVSRCRPRSPGTRTAARHCAQRTCCCPCPQHHATLCYLPSRPSLSVLHPHMPSTLHAPHGTRPATMLAASSLSTAGAAAHSCAARLVPKRAHPSSSSSRPDPRRVIGLPETPSTQPRRSI